MFNKLCVQFGQDNLAARYQREAQHRQILLDEHLTLSQSPQTAQPPISALFPYSPLTFLLYVQYCLAASI
jgi:hypothetical protein